MSSPDGSSSASMSASGAVASAVRIDSASLLENQMGKPTAYVIITVSSLNDVIQPAANQQSQTQNVRVNNEPMMMKFELIFSIPFGFFNREKL